MRRRKLLLVALVVVIAAACSIYVLQGYLRTRAIVFGAKDKLVHSLFEFTVATTKFMNEKSSNEVCSQLRASFQELAGNSRFIYDQPPSTRSHDESLRFEKTAQALAEDFDRLTKALDELPRGPADAHWCEVQKAQVLKCLLDLVQMRGQWSGGGDRLDGDRKTR
jgi:hypothetical protein